LKSAALFSSRVVHIISGIVIKYLMLENNPFLCKSQFQTTTFFSIVIIE
jgi:hypothetical protein